MPGMVASAGKAVVVERRTGSLYHRLDSSRNQHRHPEAIFIENEEFVPLRALGDDRAY
jgi:hypothetical protein